MYHIGGFKPGDFQILINDYLGKHHSPSGNHYNRYDKIHHTGISELLQGVEFSLASDRERALLFQKYTESIIAELFP